MNHSDVMARLDQATARIDEIIYLAAAISEETMSAQLRDALDDEPERLFEAFPFKANWLQRRFQDGDVIDADAFVEWQIFKGGPLGFLVKIATPVMKPHDASSASFSWGHYCTAWRYGETVDEAIANGLAWVAERRAAEYQAAGITIEPSEG